MSLTCTEEKEPLPETDRAVGIDRGITDVLVPPDGFKSGPPTHLDEDLYRLRKAQRRLSRKEKGSANRKKQKRSVARLQARGANHRNDFLPTKRCSGGGHVGETKPLSVRRWPCEEWGERHDRDVNAAKTIRAAGLAGRCR